MNETVGNNLDFAALFVHQGEPHTGLTVTVDVYRTVTAGTTKIVSAASATEIGSGLYGYRLPSASNTVEAVYLAAFYTSTQVDNHMVVDRWTVGKAAVENLDTTVSSRVGAGAGATSWTATVQTSGGAPIDGVEIWISTDSAGSSVVAGTLSTNSSGQAVFMLDPGTYYVWMQRSGYTFTNPQTATVS